MELCARSIKPLEGSRLWLRWMRADGTRQSNGVTQRLPRSKHATSCAPSRSPLRPALTAPPHAHGGTRSPPCGVAVQQFPG